MLSAEQKTDLNVALNEATLLGTEVDPARRTAALTLSVLTLPADGPAPVDDRVQVILHPVGRVAASLRLGRWDDVEAKVVPFEITELLAIVESFKVPIYGWEFFDRDEDFEEWENRLSLDRRLGDEGMSQSITLFQAADERHLDLRIWFDSLRVNDPTGRRLDLAEFVAGGKRWWDGLYSGDHRTGGRGIFPQDGFNYMRHEFPRADEPDH